MTDALLERLSAAYLPPASPSLDGVILRMWWRNNNTQDIARFLIVKESFVANRLAFIRDRGLGAKR